MIEEKHPAVARALESAFGASAYESLEPLVAADGLSTAFVYRMEVAGRPYILRLVKETIPGIDPAREFAFMQRAAEAGIAPRVWYASVEDRLMISDLVPVKPYPADIATRLAPLLRRLHDMPGVPVTTRSLDNLGMFVQRFAEANLVPQETMDVLQRLYGEAIAVYPRDERDWVPCHNDLKPQNILFDGDRCWLIDWEAAFMNDRYHDLAVVANFFAPTEAEEAAFLAAYFGRPATDYERARFFLMAQLLHVSYAAVFGLIAARGGLAWELDSPLPAFEDFQREIAAGERDLGSPEAKRLYAHLHLNRTLDRMWSQRFAEAIARVGAGGS